MRRSEQRRGAVFAIYQQQLTGRELEDLLEPDMMVFTKSLAYATANHAEEFDALISKYAEGWSLSRIAPLELAIMRVSLLEMLYPQELPGDSVIPPEGAINEAVELAKRFCGEQAPGFINGILAAILRDQVSST